MIEKFTNLFRQPQKESNLTPEQIQCKKTFELTGIVEKIEWLRDSKKVIYRQVYDDSARRTPVVSEQAHITYEPGRIEIVFDYYKYENRVGTTEKFRKISIRKYRNDFQLDYQDLRREDQNFEFISSNSDEILKKVDETILKTNVDNDQNYLIQITGRKNRIE